MKRLMFVLILVAFFCASDFAQNNSFGCPKLKINAPNNHYMVGELIPISAEIGVESKNYNVEYKWEVSAGEIVKGQGTNSIEIITNRENSGKSIEVILTIKGLSERCNSIVSENFGITPIPHCGNRPIVDYGKVKLIEEFVALDGIFIELINVPGTTAFIIFEIEESETIEQTKNHIRKLMKHIERRKYQKENIILAIRKSEKHRTKMYLVPLGASLPECENCEIINAFDL